MSDTDRIYPCADCGVLRSKDEGGTTFTVCDECWPYKGASPTGDNAEARGFARGVREAAKILDDEVAEHIADKVSDHSVNDICDDYGCSSLAFYADKIRALAPPPSAGATTGEDK